MKDFNEGLGQPKMIQVLMKDLNESTSDLVISFNYGI
jgi:hypothetical protein